MIALLIIKDNGKFLLLNCVSFDFFRYILKNYVIKPEGNCELIH